MPMRVPTVDGPSVQQQPLAGAYQRSSISPGMLQDRQLGDVGRALQDTGIQMQERQDADELMRAETLVKGQYLEWEGEAKQRKGQNAWGVTKEAGEWWDKNAAKVEEGLTSPRAKAAFRNEVAKHRAMAVGTFSGYETGQRRASLEESAQASIVGSINLAAANPGNAEVIGTAKADILKRNQLRAQINGWSPERADAERTVSLTNLHKQVIQALATGDHADAAEAYFKANEGEIEGSQRAEVGKFAAQATATKVGEAKADEVWQTMGPKGDRDPVELDKLLAAVRESSLGEEGKKAATAAVKERAAAFKDARRERDEGKEAQVNIAVMNGASGAQIRRMPEFISMDGEKQRRIMDFMETRALRYEQRAAANESRAASAEVRQQAALTRQGMGAYLTYSNPETLAGMTESQVINLLPDLGNELTARLMEHKRTLAKPGKLAEAKIDSDDFNHIARTMGVPIDESRLTPTQKEMKGELKFRVEQILETEQQAAKRTLTRQEKMDVMRREIARTVTVPGGWFSSDKTVPAIGLSPEQAAKVVVPPAESAAIKDQMLRLYNATGADEYKPTPENVRQFYLRKKTRAADMILQRK